MRGFERVTNFLLKKHKALTTVEIIVLIIVILGLVSVFSTGARSFITDMWTAVTTAANALFN